jgi:hypothetical protein
MDRDELSEVDQLLARTRESALKSLTAAVDVEEQLELIRRACTADHEQNAATRTPETQS